MILSGRDISDQIMEEIAGAVRALASPPGLAMILVGTHPSSLAYVKKKREACALVGIQSFYYPLPETISELELLKQIEECNQNPAIHGILVQLPLPEKMHAMRIVEAIAPNKDVDGFHPMNMGKLLLGLEEGFIPCTALGIKVLLERASLSVVGKHVVIVGRGLSVGKPLSVLLSQNREGCNATVTLVHSQTPHIKEHTKRADILVAALGKPRFITEDMVKEGAIVVDVGITRENNRLVGDVDFKNVEKKCHAITPVPGGVGPMTVAMLLHNTLLSYQRTHDL